MLKTTMIVESHWRIKQKHLHQYNQPRDNFVLSILTSLLISGAIEKMNAIISKNNRKVTTSRRKKSMKDWDDLQHSLIMRKDVLKEIQTR